MTENSPFNCLCSPDEPFCILQQKIYPSLKQALEKLNLTEENAQEIKGKNSQPTFSPPFYIFLLFWCILFSFLYYRGG